MEINSFKLRQTRTIFDVLGDTFKYIRNYWKSLTKMMAVYVLVPLLIGSAFFAYGFGGLFSAGFTDPYVIDDSLIFGSTLVLFGAFFFIALSYMLLYGIICQHLKHAVEGEVPMDVSEFGRGIFPKLVKLVLIFMLFFVALMIAMVVFSLIMVQISGWLMAVSIFLMFPLMIFFFVKIVLFPIALFVEDDGSFNSLVTSWELTNGYFWQTFGVYLLITIVFGILSQLLSTPLFLINAIIGAGFGESAGGFVGLLSAAILTLSFVFQTLFFGAQTISIGLHYFNLEERKEAYTLGEQIDQLEQRTSTSV